MLAPLGEESMAIAVPDMASFKLHLWPYPPTTQALALGAWLVFC